MESLSFIPITKAGKVAIWQRIRIFPSLSFGTRWKGRYTLKALPQKFLPESLIPISANVPTKAV